MELNSTAKENNLEQTIWTASEKSPDLQTDSLTARVAKRHKRSMRPMHFNTLE